MYNCFYSLHSLLNRMNSITIIAEQVKTVKVIAIYIYMCVCVCVCVCVIFNMYYIMLVNVCVCKETERIYNSNHCSYLMNTTHVISYRLLIKQPVCIQP